ncbi:MAG: flagellar hook-length control protein FliK [Aliarcobacter sp.]|nr:flagellar hook-length control protein FliK [Aliarcobacter sp.]
MPIEINEVVDENGIEQESLVVKKEEKLSLMDQLILKNNEKLTLDTINGDINTPLKDIVTKDLISSIYLGSQKNKINSQSLFNKNEAVNLLKDGNSIQAVKTSAEMLELGLENIDIDQNIDIDKIKVKKPDIQSVTRKNLIDNLLLDKNVKSEEVKNLITQSIEASNALLDNSLNLADDATVSVNSPLSFNIQSKIIGAKQQMAAVMSDIAKQMYENYKPPVTAFRINLNPIELGSISILMKNDRNNGLTISMNVTNNVTLDTLMENQNMLRSSLNKTFDESTKFNLDFSSSNQNSDNQSSNANEGQGSNRRFEQQMDTQSVLQLKEENRDIEEKSIDYM